MNLAKDFDVQNDFGKWFCHKTAGPMEPFLSYLKYALKVNWNSAQKWKGKYLLPTTWWNFHAAGLSEAIFERVTAKSVLSSGQKFYP